LITAVRKRTIVTILFLAVLILPGTRKAEGVVTVNPKLAVYAQWLLAVENSVSVHRTALSVLLDGQRKALLDAFMGSASINECAQKFKLMVPNALQKNIDTAIWKDVYFLAPSVKGIYWIPFGSKDILKETKDIMPALELRFNFPLQDKNSSIRDKALAKLRHIYPLVTADDSGADILIIPHTTKIQELLEQTIQTKQELLTP